MRRFYAPKEKFTKDKIILSLEETRHLRDVLRLCEGEKINIFDGQGKEIIEEIAPSSPESELNLTLAVALLKGEKFDLVLQKAVELGVTKFVPVNTKRSDVKLKDAEKKLERWQKISLEAAKQCGRAKLMQIELPQDLTKFTKSCEGAKALFSERNGTSFAEIKADKKITAFVGPEGGWDDSEIEFAASNDCQIVTLGGRILRAETAVITIVSLLQNHFGDLC
jgi:16S rRNA (uracil1498-N3)-methyltransferase